MNQLEKTGNKNPFKTPNGYFDNLTEQIMAQLPEKTVQPTKKISLWERVQPWIYMAAMFTGIWLMVNLFADVKSHTSKGLQLNSVAEMEDFYQYYEDQMTANAYHETMFEAFE
ncbi:hypothetical protein AGMMS50262_18420 [Bacteroidia bacterium]|nr:hypothetical protein AGMMS50262_18420 [Bacteroidia bacterium]